MDLSRQETSVTSSGRTNQKARTRRALLQAAVELLREGHPPSVPDAAQRALVSVATAYRYFPTADDLLAEASVEAADFSTLSSDVDDALASAGPSAEEKLDAMVMSLGWRMIDDQLPYRTMAKLALDRWLTRGGDGEPVREGRRERWIGQVVEPLKADGTLTSSECAELSAALTVSFGTEAMISLIDVARLNPERAKHVMLQTNRWVLAGALADAKKRARRKS